MNGLLDNWILACQEIGMALQRSSLALQSNAPYIDTTLKQQSLKHKKRGNNKRYSRDQKCFSTEQYERP